MITVKVVILISKMEMGKFWAVKNMLNGLDNN